MKTRLLVVVFIACLSSLMYGKKVYNKENHWVQLNVLENRIKGRLDLLEGREMIKAIRETRKELGSLCEIEVIINLVKRACPETSQEVVLNKSMEFFIKYSPLIKLIEEGQVVLITSLFDKVSRDYLIGTLGAKGIDASKQLAAEDWAITVLGYQSWMRTALGVIEHMRKELEVCDK